MRLEELKKGFWGYRKDAVFQYITEQEESFSQKLMEKEAQAVLVDQQAQARIQSLEQENRDLREELVQLRKRQNQNFQTILDARDSAKALKAESQAPEEAAREQVRLTLERELSELARYKKCVTALRESIQQAMSGLMRETAELEHRVEEVQEASPARNLTLFQ